MTLDELRATLAEEEFGDEEEEEELDGEQLQADLWEALGVVDSLHALADWLSRGPRHLSNYKLRELKRLKKEAWSLLEQHGYSFDSEEEEEI